MNKDKWPSIDLGRYAGTYGGYIVDKPRFSWSKAMKVVIFWVVACAILSGWSELESTCGNYVRNFLRGAKVGAIFGAVTAAVFYFVLVLIGVL